MGAIDVRAHVLTPEVDRIIATYPKWQAIGRQQPAIQGEATVHHNVRL
jgi:hypothetical protein